jgi:uncharacterized membrane protein
MGILNSGFLIAIVAHVVIGISLVWDKILLKETRSGSVINYVFWLGAMSVFGSILAVFGMHIPDMETVTVAFFAGVFDLVASYFYYRALNAGEASQTLAMMGGFAPAATALLAIPLLGSTLSGIALIGFLIMTAGGFFMFLSEKMSIRKVLPMAITAALFFGLANVFQKMAFNKTDFVTGYVFFTIGTFACALFFLIRKQWRREIFMQSRQAQPRNKVSYFSNRVFSGIGSLLVVLAISRTRPEIVSAMSGLRYVIIFLGAYFLTKWKPSWLSEEFTGRVLVIKLIATALVVAGLVLLGLAGNGGGSSSPG